METQSLIFDADEIALANLKGWGYGSASFARRLRQCYEHLGDRHLRKADLERVMGFGECILRQPVELIAGVEDALAEGPGRLLRLERFADLRAHFLSLAARAHFLIKSARPPGGPQRTARAGAPPRPAPPRGPWWRPCRV